MCLGVCGEGALTLTAAAEEYGFKKVYLKDVVHSSITLDAALNPFGRDTRMAIADIDDCGEHCASNFRIEFILRLSVMCVLYAGIS